MLNICTLIYYFSSFIYSVLYFASFVLFSCFLFCYTAFIVTFCCRVICLENLHYIAHGAIIMNDWMNEWMNDLSEVDLSLVPERSVRPKVDILAEL